MKNFIVKIDSKINEGIISISRINKEEACITFHTICGTFIKPSFENNYTADTEYYFDAIVKTSKRLVMKYHKWDKENFDEFLNWLSTHMTNNDI